MPEIHPGSLRLRIRRRGNLHVHLVPPSLSVGGRASGSLRSVGATALLAATVACGFADGSSVAAGAPTGRPSSVAAAPNTCPQDLDRWGQLRGTEPDSSGDTYRQSDNDTTNPSFYLPQQVVSSGQRWQFAYDTTVGDSPDNEDEVGLRGAQVRIEVDWYSTPGGDNSGYIGHVDGPWVNVPVNSTNATRVSHSFTAPAGAVRANVLTDLRADDQDNTWTGRNCDYRRIDGQPPAPAPRPEPEPGPGPESAAEPTTTTTAPSPARPLAAGAPPAAGAPSAGDGTAAARHHWGEPMAQGSDEFNYGSESNPVQPDPARWEHAGSGDECWPGHAGSGRRCEENARVVGGILRIVGEANGDTGWTASTFSQRYGRWEARVRSQPTSESGAPPYHPLLILWPSSDRHPQDGEYDYLENSAPGAQCVEAYMHYPHDESAPVQLEPAQRCGVDLTRWHNIAIEWTPDHVKGFVDGEEWFSFSGGANDVRRCIQCAPAMHQTIQLDNFFGDHMQPAVYEVDWARVYALP